MIVTSSSATSMTRKMVLSMSSAHHSGGQWCSPASHSAWTRLRAPAASWAVTRSVLLPERTVRTQTSNSGNVRLSSSADEDARLPVGDAETGGHRRLDNVAFTSVGANAALLFLRKHEGPAGLALTEPAGRAVRAVNQNAESRRLTTR